MCHTSPASYLVWTTFSSALLVFLFYHLWSFDKFKCLRWDAGPYSGAFKRVMTYSYLTSVPLIWIYSLGFTIIKYRAGYIFLPGTKTITVYPTPYTAWEPAARAAVFPLMFLFSVAWALEIVTHLEELCFWYFLLNSKSAQRDWFRTWHFKVWVVGSVVAILALPLLTAFTRSTPLKSEAYLFLIGSLGSLCITLWFFPILWKFPAFLDGLKNQGVDDGTVVRLTKFSELNRIRVFLRFLFVIPFLILGVDGVRLEHTLNDSMTVTDILATIAGFGCVVSSGITLVIFFPRSIDKEIAERDAARSRKTHQEIDGMDDWASRISRESFIARDYPVRGGAYLLTESPIPKNSKSLDNLDDPFSHGPPGSIWTHDVSEPRAPHKDKLPPLRPNRRGEADAELGLRGASRSIPTNPQSRISIIHHWTSPIEFGYNGSQLTFQRP